MLWGLILWLVYKETILEKNLYINHYDNNGRRISKKKNGVNWSILLASGK